MNGAETLVIPDTTAYLLLGLGVIVGMMVLLVARISVKFRQLEKDEAALEEISG
ncbi:MAG: hypothetical protein KME04_05240 [Pleurocapsa minor GSE-CHR-MK-17-07R]|jgi:hypothetical protein|nr:hypothetical protein [Pleurocapsa minor GSE-CHR-MK 17-07R]